MEITTFMNNLEILICCGLGKYDEVIYNSMEPVIFFSNFSLHNKGYRFCHLLNEHLKFVMQIIAFFTLLYVWNLNDLVGHTQRVKL